MIERMETKSIFFANGLTYKLAFRCVQVLMCFLSCLVFISCADSETSGNTEHIISLLKQYAWKSDLNYDFMDWGDNASLSSEVTTLFFLDNNKGIGKVSSKEIDSYFGSSRSVSSFSFTYNVNGSDVNIIYDNMPNVFVYSLNDNQLISKDSRDKSVYSRTNITNEDRTWLESAKYSLLPDDERLDIHINHSCTKQDVFDEGSRYDVLVYFNLSIKALEKAYSRQITSITAKYKIQNGKFNRNNPITIILNEDKDYSATNFCSVNVPKNTKATITATIYAYDSKNRKEFILSNYDYTYTVPDER